MIDQDLDLRDEIAREQYDRDFHPKYDNPFNAAYAEQWRQIELKLAHEASHTNEVPND